MEYITEALRPLAVPVTSLLPDPKNVRVHGTRNRQSVRRSLEAFGQLRPIVVKDGIIIAGNCTFEETVAMGRTMIAAIDAKHLTEEQVQAFAIMDNKSSELGEWDYHLLGDVLRDMADEMRTLTGFESFEVEPLLQADWSPRDPSADEDVKFDHAVSYKASETQAAIINNAIQVVKDLNPTVELTIGEALQFICERFLSTPR